MKRAALVAAVLAAVTAAVVGTTHYASAAPPAKACDLGKAKHVIYLQFDNTHYARDNSSVASDLEQMPHLLDFLKQNGTLFTNDHTVLISHTADGILSSLTGLYPDRQGATVGNSYEYFNGPSKTPKFSGITDFKYWTAPVDTAAGGDSLPNMITDGQKNTPAPWVPYTRAGCDFGGVGTANLELEGNSDVPLFFGAGSPEATEASQNAQLGQTDFVGIAVHCSQAGTSVCAGNAHAKSDPLPDEPGGYTGFNALFGAKYVDPAITNGKACVPDTNGDPITDPVGFCGFPGFDGMLAKNTLGYVAAMQEAGVQVTYGYISDAHDQHTPNLASDSYSSSATGPGEISHEQQLKAYDDAFQSFFDNLQKHGINKDNTLFVITVDEGDHFAGGVGTPQADSGNLVYDHRTCTTPAFPSCPSNQIGEVGVNLKSVLPSGESAFDIHFDDAPTFYVNGQPGPTDSGVRKLERDLGTTSIADPYAGGSTPISQGLVDVVGEQALHMVNTDPLRTPTLTMFGNPDFFFQTSNPCSGTAECVTPGFAWNHGDMQDEIGTTWAGFVGPGIDKNGVDSSTWTDHTNLRPTILSLLGLQDDYTDDGYVVVNALTKGDVPKALSGSSIPALETAYDQVNASFGAFSKAVIKASTKALAGDDSTYTSIEGQLTDLTSQRDTLAGQIKDALSAAAFSGTSISQSQTQSWIDQANHLISQAQSLS